MPLTTIPEHHRDPNARVDLRTWPHSAQVYLNREAAQDLITMLQNCLAITTAPTSFCIELTREVGRTKLEISSDDLSRGASRN